MESNIFSDILTTLRTVFVKKQEPIFSYLKDLSDVRRFRALVLFINNYEKQGKIIYFYIYYFIMDLFNYMNKI